MNKARRPVGFGDFHQNTTTTFTKCKTPEHEPDFVSGSGSAYWDMGDGVVRASDHWAGHNGCTGQASCVWALAGDEIAPGAWATGYAPYACFRIRGRTPVMHRVGPIDLQDAEILREAGGAISHASWTAARQTGDVPPWAARFFPGPDLIPEPAKRLFRNDPGLRAAVSAEPRRLSAILSGQPEICIGHRRA